MNARELIAALQAEIAKDPRHAELRVDCENAEDDSQSLAIVMDDHDPWEGGDDEPPEDLRARRIVITVTDGHRWKFETSHVDDAPVKRSAIVTDGKGSYGVIVSNDMPTKRRRR